MPEHYAEIIKELTHAEQTLITFPKPNVDSCVPISRSVSSIESDGDGCFVNVNIQYQINKYATDACCETPCECPQDQAVQCISYSTNQDDAETGAQVGDTYLVPNGAPAGPNPEWSSHDNEIAVWNGSGWDYTQPSLGSLAFVEDSGVSGEYYISKWDTVADVWVVGFMAVVSAVDQVGATCIWTVKGSVPANVFAKLQYRVSPAGPWLDSIPAPATQTSATVSHLLI